MPGGRGLALVKAGLLHSRTLHFTNEVACHWLVIVACGSAARLSGAKRPFRPSTCQRLAIGTVERHFPRPRSGFRHLSSPLSQLQPCGVAQLSLPQLKTRNVHMDFIEGLLWLLVPKASGAPEP